MEHYRRLGLSHRIRKLGLPPGHPTDVGYFTRLNGWELARLPMPSESERTRALEGAPAAHQVPEPIFRSNQMYVEKLLLEHAATLPHVQLRFGWHCTGWRESADGVSVDIEEVAGGRKEALRGAYLVGCDGGQSFVRRRLGIRYGGDGGLDQPFFGGAMVSTYLRAPALYQRIIRNPCWQYWTVNRDARTAIVALDGQDEFVMLGKLKTAEDKPNDAVIARLFHAAVGEPVDVQFVGHWPWTGGQALVADRYGAGRVLLAGDAVHLFTPTGGFGMNTGLDDAANLAWKLAATVQGWGGPQLLASYELERRPIGIRNTSAARRLARNVGDVPVGPSIEEDSAAGAADRRKAGDFLAGFGEEFASIGVQLGARYDGSPIVASDGSSPPPDDPAVYVPTACPGGRTPHLWLSPGASLFDRLGNGFTLLRFNAKTDSSPLETAAGKRSVPLKILDVNLAEGRELYGCDLALVRPDQHVAWRGNRLPDDCDALLAKVTGYQT
jgi:2-polyprenyl-6-methoxyphenol hydroxylase-like FAD-dependent oxidoreductase